MRTLCLLRHAKAAQPAEGQSDIDRPLTERGRRDAARIGERLAEFGIDLALLSNARRTRKTWEIASQNLEGSSVLTLEPALYLCPAGSIIAKLREIPDRFRSVVVIGHNPDLHDVALWLADNSAPSLAQSELRRKFPTSALAAFNLNISHWANLAPQTAKLILFATPATGIAVEPRETFR